MGREETSLKEEVPAIAGLSVANTPKVDYL